MHLNAVYRKKNSTMLDYHTVSYMCMQRNEKYFNGFARDVFEELENKLFFNQNHDYVYQQRAYVLEFRDYGNERHNSRRTSTNVAFDLCDQMTYRTYDNWDNLLRHNARIKTIITRDRFRFTNTCFQLFGFTFT